VPVASATTGFTSFLMTPDFSMWNRPAIYLAAMTIAAVASLETLLNLEAVDKIDPQKRSSPPNRELLAQGVGNILSGLLGGLPVTSVIIRGSVNVSAGARTKLSAIFHGVLLLFSVVALPMYLNMIPLAALAAILFVTGIKLASPSLFRRMAAGGRYQLVPFLVTLLAIVFSDLLIGILIGLVVSIVFVLNSSIRFPVQTVKEKHLGSEVMRIELANQVSFLNRASIQAVLESTPKGTHLLLDGSSCDYIDPDVLSLFRDFRDTTAKARKVEISFRGFRRKYKMNDDIRYVEHATKELQQLLTPDDVLEILKEGNQRFLAGKRLSRNVLEQVVATSSGQYPLAAVLSCIDSRAPVETILDLGLGDIFSIRLAGNVTSPGVIGSLEYACSVAGAKLVMVLGHTRCGAVTSTVQAQYAGIDVGQATGCTHLHYIVDEIRHSINATDGSPESRVVHSGPPQSVAQVSEAIIEKVARQNVRHSLKQILNRSDTIRNLVEVGKVSMVGAMYDVATGEVEFYEKEAHGLMSAANR
ncbi:MAG: carbonic anhydrase, partial [Rubripirellula sp.]